MQHVSSHSCSPGAHLVQWAASKQNLHLTCICRDGLGGDTDAQSWNLLQLQRCVLCLIRSEAEKTHSHTILYSHSANNSPSLMRILLLTRCWSNKVPTARQTTKETILDGTPQSIPSLAVSKHFKTGTAVLQRAERERCVKRGQAD